MNIRLEILKQSDEEQFIKDNQAAFNYGAEQYFNEQELKEQHEEEGQIISRKTIVNSIHQEGSLTYWIIAVSIIIIKKHAKLLKQYVKKTCKYIDYLM